MNEQKLIMKSCNPGTDKKYMNQIGMNGFMNMNIFRATLLFLKVPPKEPNAYFTFGVILQLLEYVGQSVCIESRVFILMHYGSYFILICMQCSVYF